jgi:hypothetical protein
LDLFTEIIGDLASIEIRASDSRCRTRLAVGET